MNNIVKAEFKSVKANLKGYVRRKIKGRVYPGIKEEKEGEIEGMLWLNVTPEAITRLNIFEGYEYISREVEVLVKGVPTTAMVYIYAFPAELSEEEWSFEVFNKHHSHLYSGERK